VSTMTVETQPVPASTVDVARFIDPRKPASWSRQMINLLEAGHYREAYEVLARHMPYVENMLRPYAEHLAGRPNAWTHLHTRISSFLDHSQPLCVLDVGCAIGCHAIELARKGHRTWGIDILGPMVERGRELAASLGLAERVQLVEGDIRRLPEIFSENQFDAVVACDIFEHLDDAGLAQLLRGIRHVVRPGGTVVIQTSPGRFYYWFEPKRRKLLALLVPFAWLPDRLFSAYVRMLEAGPLRALRHEHVRFYRHEYGHINCMDPQHLRRLMIDAGLVRVRTFAEHTHPGFKDEGCMRAAWTRRLFGRKSAAGRNVYGVATVP